MGEITQFLGANTFLLKLGESTKLLEEYIFPLLGESTKNVGSRKFFFNNLGESTQLLGENTALPKLGESTKIVGES